MRANSKPELQDVKTIFESFRAGRTGKERLPENLWAAAVELLDHYPFREVWRELRVKPEYLKRRAELAKGRPTQPVEKKIEKKKKFLALTACELTAINNGGKKNVADPLPTQAIDECRLVIERVDGSRLTVNVPIDWSRIEAMCSSFLRG